MPTVRFDPTTTLLDVSPSTDEANLANFKAPASNSADVKCYRVALLSGISRTSGLVAEYIVAIDVTRVRFPADAIVLHTGFLAGLLNSFKI